MKIETEYHAGDRVQLRLSLQTLSVDTHSRIQELPKEDRNAIDAILDNAISNIASRIREKSSPKKA